MRQPCSYLLPTSKKKPINSPSLNRNCTNYAIKNSSKRHNLIERKHKNVIFFKNENKKLTLLKDYSNIHPYKFNYQKINCFKISEVRCPILLESKFAQILNAVTKNHLA